MRLRILCAWSLTLRFIFIISVSLECQGESMVAKLKSHSPFYGKMFAIPSTSPDCEVFGHGKLLTTISFPLNSCGIQKYEKKKNFLFIFLAFSKITKNALHNPLANFLLVQREDDGSFIATLIAISIRWFRNEETRHFASSVPSQRQIGHYQKFGDLAHLTPLGLETSPLPHLLLTFPPPF